ncbi:IclR family transcriptional regulator [Roseovarius sp.]|uniref:IclR family transcriptional regulator n=1 Tax=Roseovarius sp. TaxID=1486281 RepID=UPI000C628819|nr:IclR family transcriptional regulator [Roseovarius sp.]MAZ20444.1 transcriptional regulator [Roseovarius sp.]
MPDTPADQQPPAGLKLDSTLSKGLVILEALAAAPGGLGVTELSRDLSLTKSTVFRLLQTLCAMGFARSTQDRRYEATLKTWQVGRRVVDNLNLRDLAADAMQMLSRESLETVYLGVPEGFSVIYIDKIDSQQPIRSWNPVGGAAPIQCVGTGKAILSVNYSQYRNALASRLTAYTDRSITSLAKLDADLQLAQKNGFAFDRGEFREGVIGFGAPICLPQGQAVAALGISMPEVNLRDGDLARLGKIVRQAADTVCARLASR